MRRRDLIALLAGAAIARPRLARAQQPGLPVIGFLNPRSPERAANVLAAFRRGLEDAGYIEGRNVAVEYRWAEDRIDRLPELAADLVRHPLAVIVAGATSSARAAMATTKTVPIVFTTAVDPVRLGLVASLNRPGGNVTGATFYSSVLVAKQLELLHEVAPKAVTIGMLVNPNAPTTGPSGRDAEAAARALGQQLHIVNVASERELDSAFAALAKMRADGLLLAVDPLFDSRPARLAALATRGALPTIFYLREFVDAGGLMSYGASIADAYRQAGLYAGRILKGAKPADLPVMQPSKFELVVNLKTAKTLGLTIPPTILGRADEVIE